MQLIRTVKGSRVTLLNAVCSTEVLCRYNCDMTIIQYPLPRVLSKEGHEVVRGILQYFCYE